MADEWIAGHLRGHDVLLDEEASGIPREVIHTDIYVLRPKVR